jgi:FKBP-type peptidyl-prolyl cis-trans isomerase
MVKSFLLSLMGLGVAALLAACGGQPDSVTRDFYTRMAALDLAGMEELVCEDERPAFRDSVGFLEGFSSARALQVQDFRARTERSDGTSVTMTVGGRFVSDEGGDTRLSGRVRLQRDGGEWCLSGERDGFRAIRESAAEAYFLAFDGELSGDVWTEGSGAAGILIEGGLSTPPPGGPPRILRGQETTAASGLRYVDLVRGSGPQPEAGQTVVVRYTLWLEASGAMIDSSRGGEPFEFVLGGGLVVDGFDEGIATMREGGRRRLIVPPRLGYGDDDDYEDIPPNSTLIFDVELVDVR